MIMSRSLRLSTILAMLVLFSMILTACKLPASEGPSTSDGTEFPVPEVTITDQSMGGLDPAQIQTQTAAAQQAQGQTGQPTPTAQLPPAITETPVSQPTQPPPPQPTAVKIEPTPGIPATYTLQKGEFPFCIARRFDVNQYEILNINGLSLASKPQVGFTLKIPQTGNHFVGDRALLSHPTTYTVKAGDTIYEVACAFGDVSPDMIALANGLSAPYNLTAGATLQIP